ncbi:hypothetical protein AWB71_05243 [Caballeronia peredens]|nr:hypothetical protein AWB71_05243 [Caballeronia peredens]
MTETTSTLTYNTVKSRAFALAQQFIDLGFIKVNSDWTVDLENIASAAKPVTFEAMLSVVASNPAIEASKDPSISNLMLVIDASIKAQIERDARDYLNSYFQKN